MSAVRGSTKARGVATDVQLPSLPRPDLENSNFLNRDARLADLVDRLVGEVVLRHASGRRCLDLGVGRPQVCAWVERVCGSLDRVEQTALANPLPDPAPLRRLPHDDGAFDLAYALRTFPHLGHDENSSDVMFSALLQEMARVIAHDGAALIELYNPRSLWGMSVGVRRPAKLLDKRSLVIERETIEDDTTGAWDEGTGDQWSVTRLDSLAALERLLPPSLRIAGVHGVGIVTLVSQQLEVPVLGRLLRWLEWRLRDVSPTRTMGAHLLVELRRKKPTRS